LEDQIDQVISELGSEAFQGLPGASGEFILTQESLHTNSHPSINITFETDAETKALIRLKVSKSKLYKAKLGVLEVQKRWNHRGSGVYLDLKVFIWSL
jgi:hypothetical protein